MRRTTIALVLASACTNEGITITPVIETAFEDAEADGFRGIDRIEIAIAHAGDEANLAARTFERGDALELDGVPFGDDLVIHLRGLVGNNPVAYGRSCTFSVDADTRQLSPHVFFSRTQTFASTALVPQRRDGGRGVSVLGNGLFLGGTFEGTSVREIERFDPASGELTVGVETIGERTGAVEALIGKSPPRVVLIGGKIGTAGADFLEVIDPESSERPVELHFDSRLGRTDMTATSLTDGRVVAIGGYDPAGIAVGTSTLIDLTAPMLLEDPPRAVLAHPRARHTATRLGDDVSAPVLIVGGVDNAGVPVAIAELFKPQSKDLALPATFAPTMIVPRSRHVAVLLNDGSVMIIGGVDADNKSVLQLERYTRDAGFLALPGSLDSGVVDATVTTLPDGYLISGGRASIGGEPTTLALLAFLTEAGTPAIANATRLGVARAGNQAAALCDGTVLITGGAEAGAVAERYNPPEKGRR